MRERKTQRWRGRDEGEKDSRKGRDEAEKDSEREWEMREREREGERERERDSDSGRGEKPGREKSRQVSQWRPSVYTYLQLMYSQRD